MRGGQNRPGFCGLGRKVFWHLQIFAKDEDKHLAKRERWVNGYIFQEMQSLSTM
jgi:hypothetical protein